MAFRNFIGQSRFDALKLERKFLPTLRPYFDFNYCFHIRNGNFFSDDLTALAELLALFGTKAVQETANQYGKRLICSEQVPGQDLQLLCQTLAERKPSEYKNPEPGM